MKSIYVIEQRRNWYKLKRNKIKSILIKTENYEIDIYVYLSENKLNPYMLKRK